MRENPGSRARIVPRRGWRPSALRTGGPMAVSESAPPPLPSPSFVIRCLPHPGPPRKPRQPTPLPPSSLLPLCRLFFFSFLFVACCYDSVQSREYQIAGVFPFGSFEDLEQIFRKTVARLNGAESDPHSSVSFKALALPVLGSPPNLLVYLCDAVFHANISAFVVFGDQNTINTISIVTRHIGAPMLGYNVEKKPVLLRGERPLYLQLDPGKPQIAKSLVRILEANEWFYASLIIEDTYSSDGFVETFHRLTSNTTVWMVEDYIRVSSSTRRDAIEYQMLNLRENQSRVIVLHCSPRLARLIFDVAEQNFFVQHYAWFVTDVVIRSERLVQTFPVGLVAVNVTQAMSPRELLPDAVRLVGAALKDFDGEEEEGRRKGPPEDGTVFSSTGNLERGKEHGAGCWVKPQNRSQSGHRLYRILKRTSVATSFGQLSFNDDGVRTSVHDLQILNLVLSEDGSKRWNVIGNLQNDTPHYSTIVWPGNTVSGPAAKGRRTLRVVTVVVEPFVMEQQAMGQCVTSMPCLRVKTKDKETLDDIFKNFSRKIHHNGTAQYNVSCCQGLSIMLIEKLARDLQFDIQLYITADDQYGSVEPDGSWNGMVDDLKKGLAHMAISAFSVTKSRSREIDFTYPYFYSAFSILVSEKKRSPPVYAFMEPFDGYVWISIVCSATVVAVALSLLEWNSPFGLNPWGRKRKTNYTLGSGLNMVYAILFQHTIKTKSPKAWPSKWLQNFWAGASIFIYSSYTANLAAFLAGKNSRVVISGLEDQGLLEPGTRIGILRGTAVEDYTRLVNSRLLTKAFRYDASLPVDVAVALILNGTIDAYLDDTPVLEYARTAVDSKCLLRLVGRGFGEDAYAIGLPKNSWLKEMLTSKILEYHESGYTDDLKDLFFRRSKCNYHSNDGQLQGEAASMDFDQHAGLYLLLVVGVFVCIVLMLLEHATFKWMVPYWRRKPTISFWKSPSMMFWSQRLHRIITSEQLVSPHHSAREMIEVVKNRDFAKLFQKSVRKQEKIARNRKNLFNVVEQLKWKNRPDDQALRPSTLGTDVSFDSTQSGQLAPSTVVNDESMSSFPKSPVSDDILQSPGGASCLPLVSHPAFGRADHPPSHGDDAAIGQCRRLRQPLVRSKQTIYGSPLDSPETIGTEVDDEMIELPVCGGGGGQSSGSTKSKRKRADSGSVSMRSPPSKSTFLRQMATAAAADISGERTLPNGVVVISPNGGLGQSIPCIRRRAGSEFLLSRARFGGSRIEGPVTTTAEESAAKKDALERIVSLPIDNLSRSQTVTGAQRRRRGEDNATERGLPWPWQQQQQQRRAMVVGSEDEVELKTLSKEELFRMWKISERELNARLVEAIRQNTEMQEKLESITTTKPDL